MIIKKIKIRRDQKMPMHFRWNSNRFSTNQLFPKIDFSTSIWCCCSHGDDRWKTPTDSCHDVYWHIRIVQREWAPCEAAEDDVVSFIRVIVKKLRWSDVGFVSMMDYYEMKSKRWRRSTRIKHVSFFELILLLPWEQLLTMKMSVIHSSWNYHWN